MKQPQTPLRCDKCGHRAPYLYPEGDEWICSFCRDILEMYRSQYGHDPCDDDAADIHGVASMKEWLGQTNVQGMTPDEMFHAWARWDIEQERNIKEQLRQMLGGQIVHIKGHEVARQSGHLELYIVDGTPLGLETAANVISIACYESGGAIPTEITKWTDLAGFDEYEAKAQGWPQDLIAAAIHEIQRRELDTPDTHTAEVMMQSPEWREDDLLSELDANIERQVQAQQEQETPTIRRTRGNAGIEWQGPGYYYSDPDRRWLWVRATSLEQLESYKHTMHFGEDDLQ